MSDTADPLATRRSLLSALARRDEDAWERFNQLYGPSLRSIALGRGLSPHDADDVYQQLLLEICQQIGNLDRTREVGRGFFRSWLFIKARWRSDDHRKKSDRIPRPFASTPDDSRTSPCEEFPDPNPNSPEESSDLQFAREIDARIHQTLAQHCESRHLRAFHLRRNEGWPANRVAAYLGVDGADVDRWVFRIQKQYDKELARILKRLVDQP